MPKKLTQDEWIAKARVVHGDRYGYELVEYHRSSQHIKVVCFSHGPWSTTPNKHIMGRGCPRCYGFGKTTFDFVEEAKAVHGERYDYSDTVYTGAKDKVSIVCRETGHGAFLAAAEHHLQGTGCPTCAGKNISTASFILAARDVHGNKYDYADSLYTGAKAGLSIKCRKHGEFTMNPNNHLAGQGCPKCANVGPSKPELEILEFVRTLGVEAESSNREVIKPLELDIYVPAANLAIEMNGVHFHNDHRKAKNYHRDKMLAAKAAGVRLIQVTDDDWKRRRPQLERMIRNALGKSQDVKIPARKCTVQQITTREAQAFLDRWHPQGKGSSRVTCFGLFHAEHGLCAVMTFAKDAYRRNPQGVTKGEHWGKYSLCRYTTSANVQGGASKLFRHVVKALELDEVDSFSSNDWFGGKLYETLGFTVVEEITPDYRVYHPKTGLRGKSTWRRTNIPARLKEIGSDIIFDPETDRRTEWMLEDEVGAKRIWDSGKIRWVWKADK